MNVAVAAALVLLHGTVMRGPANAAPAAHFTLAFVRSDGRVTRVTTDAAGHYSVRLKTAPYTVRVPRILPGGFWLIRSTEVDFIIRR